MHARHPRPHMQPQFMTMIKELGRVPPFPSARLPRDTTLGAIRGCSIHYPGIHHCRRGEVSSNSVLIEATKFVRPHRSRMHHYIINACSTEPNMTRSLINIGEGYHRGALNMTSNHSHPSHLVFSTCRPLVSSPSLRLRCSSTL
jgi:hypothetical protein